MGFGQLNNLSWLLQAIRSRRYLLKPPAPQLCLVSPCCPANPPPSSAWHSPPDWFTGICFLHPHKHLSSPTQTPLDLFTFQMKILCISEAPCQPLISLTLSRCSSIHACLLPFPYLTHFSISAPPVPPLASSAHIMVASLSPDSSSYRLLITVRPPDFPDRHYSTTGFLVSQKAPMR